MFAKIVFASLIAAGGADAMAQTPQPDPAVIRAVDAGKSAQHLQLAADLGCPRDYDRRRGYDKRCYRRNADPYHDDRRGRYKDERYYDEQPGRYSDRGSRHYDDNDTYRDDLGPRDTLRDREGRPYPEDGRGFDEDVPRSRRGAFEEPAPRERRFDERGFDNPRPPRFQDDDFRRFREDRAPRGYYQRSSYREPYSKKKATVPMTITANRMTRTADRNQSADFAAGSTV